MTARRAVLRTRLRLLLAAAHLHHRVVEVVAQVATWHDALVDGVAFRWSEFVDSLDSEALDVLAELRREQAQRLRLELAERLSRDAAVAPRKEKS